MNEPAWVGTLLGLARRGPGVIRGIGDDCAVLKSPGVGGEDLLVSTDMCIEGVHFTCPPFLAHEAGYRAVARALSDIAAMGGKPRWHCLSVAWGPSTDEAWAREFMEGAAQAGDRFHSALVGGDTSHAAVFACDVTVIGTAPHGEALLRSGAKPGHQIYVSGLLGGSEYGRAHGRHRPEAWACHAFPDPRIGLGQFLRGKASACMDISDGLSLDLYRLCEASGVSADLDGDLPCWPGVELAEAIHAGEDYELLFTAPIGVKIPRSWHGIRITRIGEIRRGNAASIRAWGDILRPSGYDHLAGR